MKRMSGRIGEEDPSSVGTVKDQVPAWASNDEASACDERVPKRQVPGKTDGPGLGKNSVDP